MPEGHLLSPRLLDDINRVIRCWRWQSRPGGYAFQGSPPIGCLSFPIELDTSLDPDSDEWPQVYKLKIDEDGNVIDPDYENDETFEAIEVTNSLRAFGYQDTGDDEPGARGIATQLMGRCVIVEIQQRARRCKGTLAGALAKTDASVSVDNIVPTDGGQDPDPDNEGLTVYNRRNLSGTGGYEGVDNEVVYFEWNADAEQWEIYDMACK
jgi:hypothetical protein